MLRCWPSLARLSCFGASAALSLVVAGCGDNSHSGSTGSSPTPAATTLALTTSATGTVTNAQNVTATVTVTAGSGATAPAGTVVLSSGSYASLPVAASAGQATITVPTALLQVGADTLTATFTPTGGATDEVTGTATLTIANANLPAPVVTATPSTYTTAANPFRAVQTASGAVLVSYANGIEVFTPIPGGGLQFSCNNPLRAAFQADGDSVLGINLLPGGNGLGAAIGSDGALFFNNLPTLIACKDTGVPVSQGAVSANEGSFDVAVTPDGKYAFVANEYGVAAGATPEGNVGVVSLQYDSSGDIISGTLVGQIATAGRAIAGVTLSHDGTRLYVTSEIASTPAANAGASNTTLTKNTCVQEAGGTPMANGLLTLIDVATAETAPGPGAIVSTVNAGCSPVRAVETTDGNTLWVAARGDNNVLAFSTGMLRLSAGNALLGYANTGGTSPVGLRLFDNDKLLAVANSNRFSSDGSGTTNAAILSVAIPSAASVVQTVPTGSFPREITLEQDGSTLLLTNFQSSSLEAIATTVQ